MSFPPGDMVAAFSRYLYYQSLESTLRERHPEVAHRVYRPDTEPLHVKIKLDETRSVVLAIVKFGQHFAWTVVTPYQDDPSVWPLSTSDDVLVDALHAHASSLLNDHAVTSPWRWHESERSDAVQLADLLTERGIFVQRVIATNRSYIVGKPGSHRIGITNRSEGNYVQVSHPEATLRISRKPRLGWMIDLFDVFGQAWRRVDLGFHQSGGSWPFPGSVGQDVTLPDLVEIAANDWGEGWTTHGSWSPHQGPRRRQESLRRQAVVELDVHNLLTAAAEQLRAMGFSDVRDPNGEAAPQSETFHIECRRRSKDLGLGDIQRLQGIAAAEGKQLLVLAVDSWMTKPAVAFADKARAFVFRVDTTDGRLADLSSHACEAVLPSTLHPNDVS